MRLAPRFRGAKPLIHYLLAIRYCGRRRLERPWTAPECENRGGQHDGGGCQAEVSRLARLESSSSSTSRMCSRVVPWSSRLEQSFRNYEASPFVLAPLLRARLPCSHQPMEVTATTSYLSRLERGIGNLAYASIREVTLTLAGWTIWTRAEFGCRYKLPDLPRVDRTLSPAGRHPLGERRRRIIRYVLRAVSPALPSPPRAPTLSGGSRCARSR